MQSQRTNLGNVILLLKSLGIHNMNAAYRKDTCTQLKCRSNGRTWATWSCC